VETSSHTIERGRNATKSISLNMPVPSRMILQISKETTEAKKSDVENSQGK
jgi:hypothetical protein